MDLRLDLLDHEDSSTKLKVYFKMAKYSIHSEENAKTHNLNEHSRLANITYQVIITLFYLQSGSNQLRPYQPSRQGVGPYGMKTSPLFGES